MPTYEWQCNCGLKFDAFAKMANRTKPKKCPECGGDASLVLPSTVAGHFNKTVTGPVPQNTGIAGLDSHIDKVIGQSAKQGWTVAEERARDKRKVIYDNPGTRVEDLSRNPGGEGYRVMKSNESAAHQRSQEIHKKAMSWKAGGKTG